MKTPKLSSLPRSRAFALFGALAMTAALPARSAMAAGVIKVACIGEHTTHSHHLEFAQEYPAHLQTLLGAGYEVKNFGDGVGMLTTGHPPGDYMEFVKSVGYMQSLTYPADIVIFGPWGKHDSEATGGYDPAVNKLDPAQFKAAYQALLQTYVDLPSHPKVLLALPIPFPFGASTGPLTTVVLPTVKDVAATTKFPTFDLYNLFLNKMADYKDLDHLTDETVRAYVGSGQEKHVKAVADALMTLAMGADAGTGVASDAGAGAGGSKATSEPDAAAATAGAGGSGNGTGSGSGGASGVGVGPGAGGASGATVGASGSADDAPMDVASDSPAASGCACTMVGESGASGPSLIGWAALLLPFARRRRAIVA